MMNKAIKTLLFAVSLILGGNIQAQTPWLTPADMPNAVRFLPPPPDTASPAFAYDIAGILRAVRDDPFPRGDP